jgi:hypothetical protein
MKRTTIILAVALARAAYADPAPSPAPPPSADKMDAKALMKLGVKLLEEDKNYLGALAVFKDAYARFPSPRILLNIGTTLKVLNRNAEAANTYQRYLDSTDKDPAARASVTQELAALDKQLAKLDIAAPPEAEIQIDEEGWISSSLGKNYRVAPGKYAVHARRAGYKPFEATGDITVGQQVPVTVALEEIPKEKVILRVPTIVEQAPVEEEPRSRVGVVAFGHFDTKGAGAAFVGATFDVTERLGITAAGILGENYGGYFGASFALLTGTLRPLISAGMPIFFNDGARYALRGAAGLEYAANRHFSIVVEAGVEHNLNPQAQVTIGTMMHNITATSFIPSVGVTARY